MQFCFFFLLQLCQNIRWEVSQLFAFPLDVQGRENSGLTATTTVCVIKQILHDTQLSHLLLTLTAQTFF